MKEEENIFKKPKGLLNLGLSCYMNSLLQCLYYIPELREYFIENKESFNEKPICKALAEIMNKLKNDDSEYIIPNNFRNEIRKINKLFSEDKPSDVKDLFVNLVDSLIEELNSEKKTNKEYENNDYNEDDSFDKKKLFLNLQKENDNNNIINKLFGGYYLTTIKCKGTNFYTIQNESFILFDLNKIYEANKNLDFYSCFDYFVKPKFSSYYCPKCKKVHEAESTESIYKLPKILAIVLERGKSKKFKGKFQIMSEILVLQKYIDEKKYTDDKTLYQLIGLSTHSGSSSSEGHYTACCMADNGKYYYFSDICVKEIELKDLYENEPYILFYMKTEKKSNNIEETKRGDDIKMHKEINSLYESKDKFKQYINFFLKNPDDNYSIDYYNKLNEEETNPFIWKVIIKGKNNENYIFKFDFNKNYKNDLARITTLESSIDNLNFQNYSLLFQWKYKNNRNTLENIYMYIRYIYKLIINPEEKLFKTYSSQNNKKSKEESEKSIIK